MDFNSQNGPQFKGQKTGRIYLTTHRMIFNNKKSTEAMMSFSAPFVSLSNVEVEQPVFGANFIKGFVQAQEHGGFQGRVAFKMVFKNGGAIDFAQTMLRAVQMARRNYQFDAPPPYMPPSGNLYPAPPPSYTPSPQGNFTAFNHSFGSITALDISRLLWMASIDPGISKSATTQHRFHAR